MLAYIKMSVSYVVSTIRHKTVLRTLCCVLLLVSDELQRAAENEKVLKRIEKV